MAIFLCLGAGILELAVVWGVLAEAERDTSVGDQGLVVRGVGRAVVVVAGSGGADACLALPGLAGSTRNHALCLLAAASLLR